MANKYYDGSEKKSDPEKIVKTNKSVGRKIVNSIGSLSGIAVVVILALFGIKKE